MDLSFGQGQSENDKILTQDLKIDILSFFLLLHIPPPRQRLTIAFLRPLNEIETNNFFQLLKFLNREDVLSFSIPFPSIFFSVISQQETNHFLLPTFWPKS